MSLRVINILILLGLAYVEIQAVCWQKNTKREANRDVFMCRNQYHEPGKQFADPENCQCYYHCNYRQQPCYYCCLDGQSYHPTIGCLPSKAFNCVDKPSEFNCTSTGKYSHKHCRKYWDCSNGKPVEEACLNDQHWDDQEKRCRDDREVYENSPNCNHD